jgi:hypothetical protein
MTVDPREILSEFSARVAGAVVERLGGGSVESIFISGGAARNEIASFRTDAEIEIYSDLDVFVILRGESGLEAARRAARDAASKLPRRGRGFRIFPPPDVGVFSESDFAAQKARPGTVEIRESHAVLYGNEETPLKTSKFSASLIEPAEGLYLLENRLSEIAVLREEAKREGSSGFARYLRYSLLKSCADAGSAVLILLGRFHPGRGERLKSFRTALARGELEGLMPEGSAERIESSFDGLSRLQETLESGPLGDSPGGGADERTEEKTLLGVWKRIAGRIAPEAPGEWAALLEWRCKAGRWVANARELAALAGRGSLSRAHVLIHSAQLARFSPVDSLRLWGLAVALAETDRSGGDPRACDAAAKRFIAHLDDLTKTFRYANGSVFDRARRMFEETA